MAGAGAGVRTRQLTAWGDKPCYGDVFHVRRQCKAAANVLARPVQGNTSRREALALELELDADKVGGAGRRLSARLDRAGQAEAQARKLAADVKTLTGWLGHDMLSLAGPNIEERRELFDFIVPQLTLRERLSVHQPAGSIRGACLRRPVNAQVESAYFACRTVGNQGLARHWIADRVGCACVSTNTQTSCSRSGMNMLA